MYFGMLVLHLIDTIKLYVIDTYIYCGHIRWWKWNALHRTIFKLAYHKWGKAFKQRIYIYIYIYIFISLSKSSQFISFRIEWILYNLKPKQTIICHRTQPYGNYVFCLKENNQTITLGCNQATMLRANTSKKFIF